MILLPQQVVYFGFYCTPKKLQIESSAKRNKITILLHLKFIGILKMFILSFCVSVISVANYGNTFLILISTK